MRLMVLGGCGGWPTATAGCGGYLVVHEGYRLLIDPGYAVLPRLLSVLPAERVDAVLISHGHPDHSADLNPLLRARALGPDRPPPLPVYALPGAVDAVLALDRPAIWQHACTLHEFRTGQRFEVGPFAVDGWALPHHVPNAGLRLEAGGRVLAYTGDTGPSPHIRDLADGANLFVAEASYPEQVPQENAAFLSSARDAAADAARAGVGHLLLTHLWPGTDLDRYRDAAAAYTGPLDVALPGTAITLL